MDKVSRDAVERVAEQLCAPQRRAERARPRVAEHRRLDRAREDVEVRQQLLRVPILVEREDTVRAVDHVVRARDALVLEALAVAPDPGRVVAPAVVAFSFPLYPQLNGLFAHSQN